MWYGSGNVKKQWIHTPTESQPSGRIISWMMLGAVSSISASRFWVLSCTDLSSVPGTLGHQSLKSLGIFSRVTWILKLTSIINQKTFLALRKEEPELKMKVLPLKLARAHMKAPAKWESFGRESSVWRSLHCTWLPHTWSLLVLAPHFHDPRYVWQSEF